MHVFGSLTDAQVSQTFGMLQRPNMDRSTITRWPSWLSFHSHFTSLFGFYLSLWIHHCLLFSYSPALSLSLSYLFPAIVLIVGISTTLHLNKHSGEPNKPAVSTVYAFKASRFPTNFKIFPICHSEAVIQINDFTCFLAQADWPQGLIHFFYSGTVQSEDFTLPCLCCKPVGLSSILMLYITES